MTLPNGTVIDYLIDPENRRVGKKKNGQLQYGLLYQDALNPVAQLGPDNRLEALFLYAEKSNVPSEIVKGSTRYRVISDHLGSVRAVIRMSDGTVVQEIDYDVWGGASADSSMRRPGAANTLKDGCR